MEYRTTRVGRLIPKKFQIKLQDWKENCVDGKLFVLTKDRSIGSSDQSMDQIDLDHATQLIEKKKRSLNEDKERIELINMISKTNQMIELTNANNKYIKHKFEDELKNLSKQLTVIETFCKKIEEDDK